MQQNLNVDIRLVRMVKRVKPWFMVHGSVYGSIHGMAHSLVHGLVHGSWFIHILIFKGLFLWTVDRGGLRVSNFL